ncbi:MAG: hypothetical protein LKCHEGNO_02969 [Burkholderiaceae bacterium]|nr:hypothetical protein [Burkholderiaceae bacterium]
MRAACIDRVGLVDPSDVLVGTTAVCVEPDFDRASDDELRAGVDEIDRWFAQTKLKVRDRVLPRARRPLRTVWSKIECRWPARSGWCPETKRWASA